MARRRTPSTSPQEATGPSPLPRWTNHALGAIWDRYPLWASALPADVPLYAIPELALAPDLLGSFFTSNSLEAEREYGRVCREHWIVGTWGSNVVSFPLLNVKDARPDQFTLNESDRKWLGWSKAHVAAVQILLGRLDGTSDRLRGIVGWLLTEPAFLDQIRQLREDYESLAVHERPQFPLGRVLADRIGGPDDVPEKVRIFGSRLREFLNRWGLTQMATWDLPAPQGPLLPSELPNGAVALPEHGIHLVIPLHYPLAGDDAILARVRELQRGQAASLGLDEGFGGIAHIDQYAQMFQLIHLERSIRSRFPTPPPRGLITAIESAACEHLGIENARSVRRLQDWIRRCRAGERNQIPRLRG